jgi:hypothetical protein
MKSCAGFASILLLSACVGGGPGDPVGTPGRDPEVGVPAGSVAPGHACSHNCGHFIYKGKLYFLQGHVHGERCGHHRIKGVWTFVREVSDEHLHTNRCGHYWHDHRWYYQEDEGGPHIHGHGCGHLYRNGTWILE